MQNCESIVTMVYECYFFNQLLHCIGMGSIIMSNDNVSFTISKRVNKKLYFIILPVGRPVSMQNFRLNVYTVYLFCHRYSLHYNVLSGLVIIRFSRSKRVNGKIICLCTRSEENLFSCKISSVVLLRLLSYASS